MTESEGTAVPDPVAPERRTARHRILHLSDPCLTARRDGGEGRSPDALDLLLHDARFLRDLDLVVLSGDVSADGSSTTYAAARRRVGSFAASHDAPHVYALGDRDDHTGFAEVLGSGHLGPDDLDIGSSGPEGERRGWCSDVDGLRVITVDTTVPGARHGQLGEDQAQWLAEVLSTPATHGSVLVLHHPPVSPDSHRHLAGIALRDPERLADVIGGTDVLLVLAGHLGVQLGGTLAGVPVLVAPGIAARTDLTTPEHLDRTVRGAGALVIDLGGPFSPRFHTLWARDPHAGEQLDLREATSGRAVPGEDAASAAGAAPAGPASLSDRIPRGESPAPAARAEATTWPEELDSSTRTVPAGAAPQPEPSRTDPVWLEDAPDGSSVSEPGAATSATAPSPSAVPSLPARPAEGVAAPVEDPVSDVEDTVLLAPVVDDRPEERAPEPRGGAEAEEHRSGAEEEQRDDDSGVLSWAFSNPEDSGAAQR